MCLGKVSSEWGRIFAAWWARSDPLLHQFLSPNLLSRQTYGIAHLFHSRWLGSLLCTCLPQLVSQILWGVPVTFSLQIPTPVSSPLQKSHKTARGTPAPQYIHVQLAKGVSKTVLHAAGVFCSADESCVTEWALTQYFPIYTLDSHHSSGGNCLGVWEFNRTYDRSFYTHYCKTNWKSSSTPT